MELTVEADFSEAVKHCGVRRPLAEIIAEVKQGAISLGLLRVSEIISALNGFSQRLLQRDNPLHAAYPNAGLGFLARWCGRRNLEALINDSLNNLEAIDSFVQSPFRSDRAYRAFPIGLVVHWMAGNVPTLALLSLLQGLVTKNSNIIKLPSEADYLFADVMDELAKIEPHGPTLVSAVAAIRYPRARTDIARALSQKANCRVFWGSDENLAILRALPKKISTTDVVYPNRTSFMVVDQNALEPKSLVSTARKAAIDISVFEQKACASPHTIFLVNDAIGSVESFAAALSDALMKTLRSIPKHPPSEREVAAILNQRSLYDMFHQAWHSKGIEYTVLADDLFQLGPPVGNRLVYIRRCAEPHRLAELITPSVQSVGLAVEPELEKELTAILGAAGVLRFSPLGSMTHFESPWDGVFLPQHLVRWCSAPSTGSRQQAGL